MKVKDLFKRGEELEKKIAEAKARRNIAKLQQLKKEEMDVRVALGGIDGKEYWQSYNEYYGTNFCTNVITVRG